MIQEKKTSMCKKCITLALLMIAPFIIMGISRGKNIFATINLHPLTISAGVIGIVIIGFVVWDEKRQEKKKGKKEERLQIKD